MCTRTTSGDNDHRQATPQSMRSRVVSEASRVGFRVRKMGMYDVKGRFTDVEGTVETGADGELQRGDLAIDASSISTRMPPRDWHLRSADFLDVSKHPQIRVVAEDLPAKSGQAIVAPVELEILGTRRIVKLTGHLHSSGPGEQEPSTTVVLHLTGAIDRHDFGVRPRRPFDWVVGREVRLNAEITLEPAN